MYGHCLRLSTIRVAEQGLRLPPGSELVSFVEWFRRIRWVAFSSVAIALKPNGIQVSGHTCLLKCAAICFRGAVIAWMRRPPTAPFHSKLSQVIFARGRCRNGLCSVRPNRSCLIESPSPADLRGAPKPVPALDTGHRIVSMSNSSPATLPPGPQLPRSVQAALMLSRGPSFLAACRRRYGSVFTLRIAGFGTLVYVADPDIIKTVFAGDPSVFHAGEANTMLGGLLGDSSLLVIDEDVHRDRRRLMLAAFHRDAVAQQAGLMAEIAAANIAGWPVGETFAAAPKMSEITLEVILRTVIGATDPARLAALRKVMPQAAQRGSMGDVGARKAGPVEPPPVARAASAHRRSRRAALRRDRRPSRRLQPGCTHRCASHAGPRRPTTTGAR